MSSSAIGGSSSFFLDLVSNKTSTAAGAGSVSDLLSSLSSSSSSSSGGSVELSDAAQFFSKLQNLSQTDPAKFKQLTTEIAGELQTAAQSATSDQATFLNNLSKQFQTASQTGDASSLEPPKSSGHHHHSHGAYQSPSPDSSTTDNSSASGVLQSIFQQVSAA